MGSDFHKDRNLITGDSKTMLELCGIVIAKYPSEVASFLKEYGVEVIDDTDEEEITEHLIDAIAAHDSAFNKEFSMFLIEKLTPGGYENFDMGGLAAGAEGGKGGGLQVGTDPVGMIAGAVGSIFNFANARQQTKTAQEQAKAATIGGILNYKAEKEKNKNRKKKDKDKNKGSGVMIAAIGAGVLFIVIILLAVSRRPAAV